jgi:hypothetical protein
VFDEADVAFIVEALGQAANQTDSLVRLSQQQTTRVRGDRPSGLPSASAKKRSASRPRTRPKLDAATPPPSPNWNSDGRSSARPCAILRTLT